MFNVESSMFNVECPRPRALTVRTVCNVMESNYDMAIPLHSRVFFRCHSAWMGTMLLLAAAVAGGGCSDNFEATPSPWTGHKEAPDEGTTAISAPTQESPVATQPATTTEIAKPIVGTVSTPTAGATLAIMHKVADWQLAYPSTDPKNGWIYAAFYDGVMALAKLDPNGNYTNAMVEQGKNNRWELGTRAYHADDHAVAQMYLELYEQTSDPAMMQATRQRFDQIYDYPQSDNLDFSRPDHDNRWSWCDALFMDPPAWARLSKVTGEPKYLASADRRWWVTSDFLYDKDEHLFYRDSTFFKQLEPNGKKVFWSRGNGWVIAGIARLLDYMPKDYPSRPKYLKQFGEMAEKIKSLQQDDGLWRTGLLDPASHPQAEESGSGFFAYALAWGINQGLLDRATYGPVVFKAWDAMTQCVQLDGKLIHVQPVGAKPEGFPESSHTPYGAGAFLLAGSEIYKMVGGK